MQTLTGILAGTPTLLGTFATLGSIEAVELVCHAGFDFLIIDGQHGAFDLAGLRAALRAVQVTDCLPIVRLPAHDLSMLEGLMDSGYPAVLAPMVNTAAHARRLVEAAYYPPMGQRSQSSCRASLMEGSDYRRRFNSDFSLLVMIEHIDALAEIEAIVSLPGIAGCFIGPTDLASSLRGQEDSEDKFRTAVNRIRDVTLAAGKLLGTTAGSVAEAREQREQGYHLVTVATDRRILWNGLKDLAGPWRAEAAA